MTNEPSHPAHIRSARPVADPVQEAIYKAQMEETAARLAVENQKTEERIAEIEYAPILQSFRYEEIMAEAEAAAALARAEAEARAQPNVVYEGVEPEGEAP